MKKYILLIMFLLFLPHYVVWGTVIISGFSVDYKSVFNADGFWALSCFWWFIGGIAGVVTVSQNAPWDVKNIE